MRQAETRTACCPLDHGVKDFVSLRLRLFQKFDTFRILVCGGDGSVGWVLSEIDTLTLHKQVPATYTQVNEPHTLSVGHLQVTANRLDGELKPVFPVSAGSSPSGHRQ